MTHKKQDEELREKLRAGVARHGWMDAASVEEEVDKIMSLIHSYVNEARVKELQFILGWYDEYGRPQFDERGIKQRIAELEGES